MLRKNSINVLGSRLLAAGIGVAAAISSATLLEPGQARADTIYYGETVTAGVASVVPENFSYTFSLAGSTYSQVAVGGIEWIPDGTKNQAPFNKTFETYCIDLLQNIYLSSNPDEYTYVVSPLINAPQPGAYPTGQTGPMGADKEADLQRLADLDYQDTTNPGAKQAFQLDIWAIVYNTYPNWQTASLTGGNFSVPLTGSGFAPDVLSTANSWLQQALNPNDGAVNNYNLYGLSGASQGIQDQVVVTPVPLPAAVWSGMVLIGGLGAARLKRRFKHKETPVL